VSGWWSRGGKDEKDGCIDLRIKSFRDRFGKFPGIIGGASKVHTSQFLK
jgi:hypothetical protein